MCILWYIWKERNNKVFSNFDIDSRDTFKLTESQSLFWAEAQSSFTRRIDQSRLPVKALVPYIPSKWCFTDGSWKSQETYSG